MECYVSGDAIVEDDSKCYPGARVALVGYLETRQKNINKRRSSCYSFKFKVVSYYNLDDYDIDESITPEEQELYNAIQSHPHPHKFLRELLFPHHLGNAAAIEAAIIQQFCGGRTISGGRDTIHILFCGDTGTGKTEIAKRVIALNPISRFASATELSSVGLIATVERDKINERWVLKAGLLPRCNGGVVCLDEIEKADDRVKAALHTSMECGISTINKASISAKVVSETGILATSNPKVYQNSEKVFQKIGKVGQNDEKVIGNFSDIIDLPVTILDRFDLIFFFEDQINAKKDEKIATLLVERDTFEEEKNTFPKKRYTFPQNQYTFSYNNNTFSYITINKYIWKLKKNQNQKIGFFKKKITLYIFRWYAEIRQASTYLGFVGKTPTPRLVESLLRFARAITRIKNKTNMGIFEIRDALELFNYVYAWDKAPEEYIKDDPTEAQKVTQNTQKVTQNPNNVTG
jgi:DNA replicative helicase MCM subunit Mcm2 (Cdc46/Mcm family)